MRISLLLLSIAIVSGCAATSSNTKTPNAEILIGTWNVDLRPKPSDAGYFQEFVVTAVDGKTFSGTFYGTPVEQARINADWGSVRIAFVTSDQSGPYNHSAILSGNGMEGLTNSTGRNFLSYWSAVKR